MSGNKIKKKPRLSSIESQPKKVVFVVVVVVAVLIVGHKKLTLKFGPN